MSIAARCKTIVAAPLFLVLLAVYLTGLAHIAVLPPFEGFDETAHYASLQLLADERRLPVYGRDRLSADVDAYQAVAPRAYASVPPFDANGGLTYHSAMESEPHRGAAARAVKASPSNPRRYQPGAGLNWQAQHPPLAYGALAPVYLITKTASWQAHLFALRAAAWSFAVAGLAIGAMATRRYGASFFGADTAGVALLVAGWPFLSPMFFPEMARLGNDAFCLFFAGAVWAIAMRMIAGTPPSLKWDVAMGAALGLALGLGALVKAFFLPIAAGAVGFTALRRLFDLAPVARRRWRALARAMAPPASAGVVFLVVAGWWYVDKWLTTGVLTGANDIVLAQANPTSTNYFSPAVYLLRLASIFLSFIWTGTWSLAKPPYIATALLGACFLGVWLVAGLAMMRRVSLRAPLILAASLITPVAIGLAYHAFVQTSLGPQGIGTPGYYLHLLAAPFGVLTAIGVLAAWRWGGLSRWLLAASGAYLAAFTAALSFAQLNLFAGCAVKAGDNRFYRATECFGDLGEIWRRIEILGEPAMGALFFGLSLLALACSVWRAAMGGSVMGGRRSLEGLDLVMSPPDG